MSGLACLAFIFGNAGFDEWALLGVIAFILFGPKRLPEIARTIGRTLARLRHAADEFRSQIEHLDEPAAPDPHPDLPPMTLPENASRDKTDEDRVGPQSQPQPENGNGSCACGASDSRALPTLDVGKGRDDLPATLAQPALTPVPRPLDCERKKDRLKA